MKTVVQAALAILAAFVFIVATAPAALGQATPPVAHVAFSRDAIHTLDSLATEARTQRVENAACLTSYGVSGDTLFLAAFSRAAYVKADSIGIFAFAPVCASGVPTLHSHVAFDGYPQPSDTDLETELHIGTWGMILSVTDTAWRIIVY